MKVEIKKSNAEVIKEKTESMKAMFTGILIYVYLFCFIYTVFSKDYHVSLLVTLIVFSAVLIFICLSGCSVIDTLFLYKKERVGNLFSLCLQVYLVYFISKYDYTHWQGEELILSFLTISLLSLNLLTFIIIYSISDISDGILIIEDVKGK